MAWRGAPTWRGAAERGGAERGGGGCDAISFVLKLVVWVGLNFIRMTLHPLWLALNKSLPIKCLH